MKKILFPLLAVFGLFLLSCGTTKPRLTQSAVSLQTASLQNYFGEREDGLPFRSSFYDSAAAFVASDTERTKFYGARLFQLRPLDSLGAVTGQDFELRERAFLHFLNVLSLTADSTL